MFGVTTKSGRAWTVYVDPYTSKVLGHTDDQPVRSLKYKDNFELSAERAKSVVEVLSQGIDKPGRFESSGAGASKPIAEPPSLPANRARNRRVEIIYYPED